MPFETPKDVLKLAEPGKEIQGVKSIASFLFPKQRVPKIPEVKTAAPQPRAASPEVRAAAADARERNRLRVGRSKSIRTSPGLLSPLTISNASLKDTLG